VEVDRWRLELEILFGVLHDLVNDPILTEKTLVHLGSNVFAGRLCQRSFGLRILG
jgi:hypothetical protein